MHQNDSALGIVAAVLCGIHESINYATNSNEQSKAELVTFFFDSKLLISTVLVDYAGRLCGSEEEDFEDD